MLPSRLVIVCNSTRLRSLCGALAICCALAQGARAHGPPPSPLSLLAVDAHGARAVRLSRGLAFRSDAGVRFVCPAAWGATDSGVVVAGAIPDGPVAVAGDTTLLLLADDGSVTPHPDADALGRVIAFAASGSSLYALQVRAGKSEVIEVGSERVRVLWSDAQSWHDLAASDSRLQVLRLGEAELVQLELTTDGEVERERQVLAPDMTLAVFARLAGSKPYVLATTHGGALLELGLVEGDEFRTVQTARGDLAGPVESSDGRRFVAIDGALNTFDGDRAVALDDPELVTCLDSAQGQAYACTRTAIRALDAGGLGAELFELSTLREPDSRHVAAAIEDECDAQWQHYRFDALAAGITLADPSEAGESDSGVDAGAHGAKAHGANADANADDDGGCSTARAHRAPAWTSAPWLVLPALLVLRKRRRRRQSVLRNERGAQVVA